ncbi:PilZ domain-containing protein [Aurantiacibacter gilvus]|uniref:PilZ domain-containing protein n=1 Tax=Aurantiacibacter gilvus TaxID=3139141 RepID=A0ABU9IHS1_9SPHN
MVAPETAGVWMGIANPSDEGMLAPATAEQRVAPRFTLLIRAAKLITPAGEFLCVIRDASESGISVRIFHALPKDKDMTIELQNGDRYWVERVWEEQDRAGFRFIQDVDIKRIVESPSRFAKRSIRLNLEAPAEISCLAGTARVTIHNISQQGASISSPMRLSLDQRVKISARGLRETGAIVRWRNGGDFGLAFEDTYQFGELARIVRLLQRK